MFQVNRSLGDGISNNSITMYCIVLYCIYYIILYCNKQFIVFYSTDLCEFISPILIAPILNSELVLFIMTTLLEKTQSSHNAFQLVKFVNKKKYSFYSNFKTDKRTKTPKMYKIYGERKQSEVILYFKNIQINKTNV